MHNNYIPCPSGIHSSPLNPPNPHLITPATFPIHRFMKNHHFQANCSSFTNNKIFLINTIEVEHLISKEISKNEGKLLEGNIQKCHKSNRLVNDNRTLFIYQFPLQQYWNYIPNCKKTISIAMDYQYSALVFTNISHIRPMLMLANSY